MLLAFSIYIRLKLQESPVFQRMKARGQGLEVAAHARASSTTRTTSTCCSRCFGATAGQGVVWYTGQFYALFFLTITLEARLPDGLHPDRRSRSLLGTPFFVVFGRLSDQIGRLKIILAGCLLAALTYFPLFKGLTHYVNPALEEFQEKTPDQRSPAERLQLPRLRRPPSTKFSDCDQAKDFLTKSGLSFESLPGVARRRRSSPRSATTELTGWDEAQLQGSAQAAPATRPAADPNRDQLRPMALLILFVMVIYVTMVYGPIAAFLVELFPTRIRYTSMSLPYHIGNGWFGGMLPPARHRDGGQAGNIYHGLWYPIVVALITVVIGALFLRETKDRSIHD